MHRAVILLLAVAGSFGAATAKAPQDNVVIISAQDEYVFSEGRAGFEVRHSRRAEYSAVRHSDVVRPHIFYNDKIRLDKASGGKMNYRDANSPTVFHDGSKVCWFEMRLAAAGKKGKADFRRTFTDAAHFTGVFLEEEYPVRERTLIFRIPQSLGRLRLVDENFPPEGIVRSESEESDGSRIIVYTVTDLAEMPDDASAPSALSSRPHISVRGYFADTDSFFGYHRRLLAVDTTLAGVPGVPEPPQSDDRLARIQWLYDFVRDNIRYVAYEEGEAAFRPDTPAETLRKRYGDCKSMSLLLATLLNRSGIKAMLAITGTDALPSRIADNPSLASADHAICIVPEADGYLFLDPTNRQISARHIPAWIRGKDAMAVDGDAYMIIDIPAVASCLSEDVTTYDYALTGSGLAGTAERVATEDLACELVASATAIPGKHAGAVLARSLAPVSGVSIPADSVRMDLARAGRVSVSAPILNARAVTELDGALYLDLNASCGPYAERIDTDGRREAYRQPFDAKFSRVSRVRLPAGCAVSLPDDYCEEYPWGTLECRFAHEDGSVVMMKHMELKGCNIPLKDLPARNDAVARWNEACNQQIEIRL